MVKPGDGVRISLETENLKKSSLIPTRLSALAELVNGELIGPDVEFTGVTTDGRELQAGDLFVAITGDNFDGHNFLSQAQTASRAAALISRPTSELSLNSESSFIRVDDTTLALGRLSASMRLKNSKLKVAAVTGSCGKTTVKTLLGSCLSKTFFPLITEGTLNNHWGVPFTLMRLQNDHDVAAIEIGANNPGEIADLVKIVKPNFATVTNIHPVHLSGFKTLMGVAKAKREIFSELSPDGIAVLNLDEPFYETLSEGLQSSQIVNTCFRTNLSHKTADVMAENIETYDKGSMVFQLIIDGRKQRVILPLMGEHNVANALNAAALAWQMGVDVEAIADALSTVDSVPGRLQRYNLKSGAILIDDSYNANPQAFKIAIELVNNEPKSNKIAVIGEMGELGEQSDSWHKALGQELFEAGFDSVLAVGDLMQQAIECFNNCAEETKNKKQKQGHWFENTEDLCKALKEVLTPDTVILVKGSRRQKLESVVKYLLEGDNTLCCYG